MEHFLHTTLPETVDDAVQAHSRPASQLFRTQQPFPWAQSSLPMDQTINHQSFHLADGTYQEGPMDDLENIVPPQMGEPDLMTRSLMMQQPTQPMFGPRSIPEPSRSMDHSSTNHSTSLNPGANANLKVRLFEEISPFASGDFDTIMLSPPLQQPAFTPSDTLPQRWPPDTTISIEQDIPPLASKYQVPLEYQTQHPPRVTRPPVRKRAPKTTTMSAQKWAPAEGRIRQLFLDEEKPYRDLMETVNTEFGFWANERQYKAKIKDMKLKRSVEAKDQIAIVRRIQHRRHAIGKETGYVRVRGHRINEAKLRRWEKEHPMLSLSRPLSPLPSEISLQTRSHLESPTLSVINISNKNSPLARSVNTNQKIDTPVTRLLKHVHGLGTTMKPNESAAIFNDFQQIISFDHDYFEQQNYPGFIQDAWSPAIGEDFLKVRNWMNLKQEVWLGKEPQEMIQHTRGSNRGLFQSGSQIVPRCGTWKTPYGRVLATFWQVQNSSEHRSDGAELPAQNSIAAKIAIYPRGIGSGPFRIALNLDPRLNPSATITYQATIPNNSEVFKIIESGKLEDLLKALEAKTASLTDRDEQGRSLLNYAKRFMRVDFCRFLLGKNFNPDATELSHSGYLAHIFDMRYWLTNQINQDDRHNQSECYRLMLEAGADFGTNIDGIPWDYGRGSGFEEVLRSQCCTTLAHVIRYGQPFVSPNTLVEIRDGHWCSPLIYLADHTDSASMHCLEKAVILLRWGVVISCRDLNGDNVLHTVLKRRRDTWYYSEVCTKEEPGEFLKVFIAAGADVYALNDAGESPSRVARNYRRKKEWFKALEFCGFDAGEVWKQTMAKNKEYAGPRQTAKLSFEEYYQEWERTGKEMWQRRCEEEHSGEEYNGEEDSGEEDSEEVEDGENEGHVEKGNHSSVDEEQGLSTTAFENMDCDGNDPAENWKGDNQDIMPQGPDENGVGTWEGILEESADHTFVQMDQDPNTTWIPSELYDPMLNDQAETMSGLSVFGDMNDARLLDRTSMAEGDFFGGKDGTFDDGFRTEFDAFMKSD